MPAASLPLAGEMDINTSQVKVSINEESKTVKVVIKGSNGTLHPSKHRSKTKQLQDLWPWLQRPWLSTLAKMIGSSELRMLKSLIL